MRYRHSLAMAGRALAGLLLCVCVAQAADPASPAAPTTAPAADTNKPASFDHLPHRNGGPDWTIELIFAALPPGPPLALDPTKPVPPVKDPIAALRAAFVELRSSEPARLQFAFRIVGATSNQTKDVAATKLLALMQHHGIGTHAEPGAAIRTALDLVRVGDRDAALFVARDSPKTFASVAKPVASVKRLADVSAPAAVRLSAPILAMDGQKLTVGAAGDKPLELQLATIVDKLKVGRVVTVAGIWGDGKLDGLVGEVPEPALDFKWELVRRPVRRGEWRLQTVKVAVINKGIQPIKRARLIVRCRLRNGGFDHVGYATVGPLAPGTSGATSVSFDTYNFDWVDTVGSPEAEVTFDELEW